MKLKRFMANASILCIVISKLRYEKKLYSIILLEINKSLEVGFYYTILPLSLTIYLQIKSSKEFLLNVKEII